jgi:GNAT superfamily N-acetyltransferase
VTSIDGGLRYATQADIDALLYLWGLVFDEDLDSVVQPWRRYARTWFEGVVNDPESACFPVIEVEGTIVATAIGTLELGAPNPQCVRGRAVRLANVVTLPDHRSRGYGTRLVDSVIEWAISIQADRVDLSATPDGQRIYEKAGFVLTSAPRMKLVLGSLRS